MRKKLPLHIRLALLVAGTTLPLIVFATGLAYFQYVQNREAASERVLDTVRGIRLVLDAEVQSITSGLQVLALSQALQRDDFAAFRRDAESFLRRYPEGTNVSLADAEGRQVLNTRMKENSPAPASVRPTLKEVFDSGGPVYSNLFTGSISGQPIIVIDVPVYRNGQVVYALAFNPPLSGFQQIVQQQQPNSGWTISIFDRSGTSLARLPDPRKTVGQKASPSLFAELLKRPEAKVITTSLEGVELLTAFTRSPLTDWTVAAGIPLSQVTAPLWRVLTVTGAIGALLLAVGLAFAVRMAREIARGEALQALMVNELNHRVKNTLATVQSIAGQTFRDAPDPVEARHKFESRLVALGRAHNILSEQRWESAEVRDVVAAVFEPLGIRRGQRLHTSGPQVRVTPRVALMLSMVLHELATNAVKYGALSNDSGTIRVGWDRQETPDGVRLQLEWTEAGGPPVAPPEHRGFGSKLIEQTISMQSGGSARIDYRPGGVYCVIDCPI